MDERTINFEKTLAGRGTGGSYTLSPDDRLGQYRVMRPLGRGGMGEVYEVEHGVLRRRYALKLLPAELARSAAGLERFQREAEVMANLEHPSIVRVDEFGETDGRYWLRMEIAEGVEVAGQHVHALDDYVAAKGGRLAADEVEGFFRRILEGLVYAHSKGAVHRDLKPGNILLFAMPDGRVFPKISDFGLVRLVGEDWVRSQAELSVRQSMSIGGDPTLAGADAGSGTRSLLGTYEYMSPEQKRGEEATPASDVYAVGLMVYRLLTGRQLGLRPPCYYVPGLPLWWDDLVLTALEEDPADRMADAGTMLTTLLDESAKNAAPKATRQGRQAGEDAKGRTQEDVERKAREEAEQAAKQEQRKVEHQAREEATRVASSPRDDQPWAVPDLGMKFVHVAPGSFQMGSADGDADGKPVHEVRITRPFWIGKYEVTQAEYEKIMGWNPSIFKGAPNPVVGVSWDDAVAFCRKLTEQERGAGQLPEGYEYRLPTEAEWEYAARGGPKSKGFTYSGSNDAEEVAWHSDDSRDKSHPVGGKKPNELGLHDMSGNVFEWCLDWYGEYPPGTVADPSGARTGRSRVFRGGSWFLNATFCRSASRNGYAPSLSFNNLGFRVALAAPVR
jgi:formylglycine-generating enzyme required for sulfatase activity